MHLFVRTCLAVAVLLAASVSLAAAQQELLSLSFEGDLNGQEGESPTVATGVTYEAGVVGMAARFNTPNNVRYPSAGNINATEGTLQFWIKPSWPGGDGQTHVFLQFGTGGGGMVFNKDGANNLRSLFNQYGPGGVPEMGVGVNVASWEAGAWKHVAYTWSSSAQRLRLYVNGQQVAQSVISAPLPGVGATTFQIGAEGTTHYASAAIDELRIHAAELTPAQVLQSFLAGISVASIETAVDAVEMYPTWRQWIAISAETSLGSLTLPAAAAAWESSDPSVASVDAQGRIVAHSPGTATLTASIGSASASVDVLVRQPVLPPDEEEVDPLLATPAEGAPYAMPVVAIRYIPTNDGVNVDSSIAAWSGTVTGLRDYVRQLERETKFMLEEGSRFRGYADPLAVPSLGYRVVRIINVYEPLPPDTNPAHGTGSPGIYFPDYEAILSRFGAQAWVDQEGVKEVWLWGYHHGNIAPVESNMSSPTTGDISNSYRFQDDLPIYSRTYVLYNYNYTRSSNESVHNHGHQLEAILGYAAQRQDGNADLFWKRFVGQNAQGQFITGRCGWTHMPPNTTSHYDYWNAAVVLSDIEDWRPSGTGQHRPVSAATWGSLQYPWPGGIVPPDIVQHNWYIYWMQAMPGLGNMIPYDIGSGRMTNWWALTADWDAEIPRVAADYGLHTTRTPNSVVQQPAPQEQAVGGTAVFSVSVTGTCPPTYQWRRNGAPIVDGPGGAAPGGGVVAGARSATLTITSVQPADAGIYDCVVTNLCGAIFSDEASLSVLGGCPADWDGDGQVNSNDISAFLIAWLADVQDGTLEADFDGSGSVNSNDISAFLTAWLEAVQVGC